MTFYNKRYLTRQNFEIKKSSLKIDRKNLFDGIEYEIPFDLIHNKYIIQTTINNSLITTGIFLIFFSFLFLTGSIPELTLILMCFGISFIILSFINRRKVISISTMDGNSIELYFNDRNKQEIVDYANEILDSANKYLVNKYSKVDRSLPIDRQLENIQFLLNREIISEDDFESLKNRLLGNENKTSIGFVPK